MTPKTIEQSNRVKWKNDIVKTLEELGIGESLIHRDNENLMYGIANNEGVFNALNHRGLLNRGFCPVTGTPLNNNDYSWAVQGRRIYVSKEVAKQDFDESSEMNRKINTAKWILIILAAILSSVLTFFVFKPSGFWQYVVLILLFTVSRFILNLTLLIPILRKLT